jgi:hypothetical protein
MGAVKSSTMMELVEAYTSFHRPAEIAGAIMD